MEKSEKSFYVIIENKKCGKFSGDSLIQVAKKVASKKLKSKKKTEITFHLDEVGGKKKRYGPYQGRKDKKTGKIVVVKGGKVMKGGVLTADDLTKLQKAFISNCNINLNQRQPLVPSIQKRIINIPFGFISTKPLIFFNLEKTDQTVNRNFRNTMIQVIVYEYKYAVFQDANGNIWIFFKNDQNQVLYNNFFEFFLNPEIILTNFAHLTRDQLKDQLINVLKNLINNGNNPIPPELKRIINEAEQILTILQSPPELTESIESIIYFPNYSEPKIKKCVYPDLTFGILDEKNLYKEGTIPSPQSLYQRFLIRRQQFFGEFSEQVIFLRIPSLNNTDRKFDLYISKKNGKLRITINSQFSSEYDFLPTALNFLLPIPNIAQYCRFLVSIPPEFGNFKTVKNTANILLQQSFSLQQSQPLALQQQPLALQQQSFALQQQRNLNALQQQQQPFALQQQRNLNALQQQRNLNALQQQRNLNALQQQPFALQQQSFALQPQQFTRQQYLTANMQKKRLSQLSFGQMSKQQKIQKQIELLQNLDNLKQELARLKIEQNRLNRQSVFPRSFISSMNNPYSNPQLKPTNISTIETEIKQIEQQLIYLMQSR
jgi:hypothetical protein